MGENIVIVESPAKAKTIEKFLGQDFTVVSSFGHIRDLAKKNYGIDVENDYTPQYEISPDKKKVVSDLKKLVKTAKLIWLASDEDREGEAIAWHLFEVLKLKKDQAKRIVFHEITKDAILNAIDNPRTINQDLVNAQQARRVLDRLVGFELSPVLWKKVKPQLSAGRVQSVAVRLIVEREKEIKAFNSVSSFKVVGNFNTVESKHIKAELPKNLDSKESAITFFNECNRSKFTVADVSKKPGKKNPAAPFTTSTLQQEASRKLGYSVSKTMTIAQKLYEGGKITYMRTDSVNLSDLALNTAKSEIIKEFGEKYYKRRNYTTKTKGAQEAHEAIRPTFLNEKEVAGSKDEVRLYELIWKRTIASQMSEALFEKTNATILISNSERKFIASGEVLLFDGFLKVYIESTDEENNEDSVKGMLPEMKTGDVLDLIDATATERFSHHPPRYTEASLVRKLEELGIGRPSTYAPTISTIQTRGYVVKEDKEGHERNYQQVTLKDGELIDEVKKENTGYEKSKMFPTDIGVVVNDFLMKYFENILDYNFTANIEKKFDEIALGNEKWIDMVDKFYKPFHNQVEETLEKSDKSVGERMLGSDPETGKKVFVKIGRYGPIAQIGEVDEEEKPKFAALRKNQHIDSITLEEALDLFKLPKTIGKYEEKEVIVGIGRFGPYVKHDNKFVSIGKGNDPMEVDLKAAIEIIEEKRKKDKEKTIKVFDKDEALHVLNGRYGPYISYKKKNYRIPKTTDPKTLSLEDCMQIIEAADKKKAGSKK